MHRNEKYVKWGITAFIVVVCSVIFGVIFTNLTGFYDMILEFLSIISSLLYGCVFAYLMSPVMDFSARWYRKLLDKTKWKEKRKDAFSRACGLVTAIIFLLATIYAFIALIGPTLVNSLSDLLRQERLDGYVNTVLSWVHDTFAGTPVDEWFSENLEAVIDLVAGWLKNVNFAELFFNVTSSVYSVITVVFNFFLGIVAAAYILIYKKQLCAQAKKLTVAIFRPQRADRILEVARRTNRIFSGFVVGKLLDALFVGVVTYIALLIMGMPFAPLIATLVGVTNIIPFFGPFIGAVPSTLLLLVENPMDALYFVIFVLVLQVVDGNIVENRILGEKLGISDFWVLVAILVFGGIFGFMGMLLGVPIFAVVYSLIVDGVNRKLAKKRYPLNTDLYYEMKDVYDLPVTPTSTVKHPEEPGYDRNVEAEDDYE